ncbi:MAG: chemotaxis protein CheW [Deltaproteobacteria bacterium]|nr:chemotaxis protein CheW [Deltaproteobacteria bacterium]
MGTAPSQYVIFRCGAERYAIELARVLQVVEEREHELEPVPSAPGPCLGVFSYYGRLIAVFDSLPLLGGSQSGTPDLEGESKGFPVWLVMRSEEYSVALRVDGVESIVEIGDGWNRPEEAQDGLVDALWQDRGTVVNRIDPQGLLHRMDCLF